jgi:cysteine desulfurase
MKRIYLDHAANSPLSPEVKEAMQPYLEDIFGNPSSLHDWGDLARDAVDKARSQVAQLVGSSEPDEIIFTASGTESNNLAIKGLAMAQQKKGKHIVISAIEHFSVMNSARTMEKMGFELSLIPVDKFGLVNPEDIKKYIRQDTILISIMLANGEVGTIEPIKEIAKITREKQIILHTDAVAACGTIPVDVKELGVDALSMAGNQFYGPKGSGALWLRHGVRIIPLFDGGIQEGGRRAGTEDVPAIVGMGKAAELASSELPKRMQHLLAMRHKLITRLPGVIENVIVTGHEELRLPGLASFCVEFVEGESMLMLLNSQGVAVSSGSSCTSRALKASHVLIAMGLSHETAQSSILFTLGIENSLKDIDSVLEIMPPIISKLRDMSPTYSKYIKAKRGGL